MSSKGQNATERMGRPHLLVAGAAVEGLRSVDDLRRGIERGPARRIWDRLREQAEAGLRQDPYLPGSMVEGRDPAQAALENRDYVIVAAACKRMQNDAVAWLVTAEERFLRDAMRQMAAIFDERKWSKWPDQAHMNLGLAADLRTGQFMRSLGYVYDWLYEGLNESERAWIVENLDRRAFQPYLQEVERGAWWTNLENMNNWNTCVVGGAGTAAMALGAAHPEAPRLLQQAVKLMEAYTSVLGPQGESNESVGYAGAMHFPIEFYTAYRYHTGGGRNRLAQSPFPEFCRWYMHFVAPPGVVMPFGDCPRGKGPTTSIFPAMASACRDGMFQWFYEQYAGRGPRGDLALELLMYDDTVAPESPEGRLPRGRAFSGHSANWSSRTDWDPHVTACVVSGKGGHGNEGHGNHDAGQVCIDAFGEPLIVDLGSTTYPADFFGPKRWQYYVASVRGHNVLMFDKREMKTGVEDRAEIIACDFDDERGGWWHGDTTALYDNAGSVRRLVVHLHPTVVAVLDEADLAEQLPISLRWHTADRCEPDVQGRFLVRSNGVSLAGLVTPCNGGEWSFSRREHLWRPPFDHDRYGNPLKQKRESYIEARCRGKHCRLLTLFCAFGPGSGVDSWQSTMDGWQIDSGSGEVIVNLNEGQLSLRNRDSGIGWTVKVSAP